MSYDFQIIRKGYNPEEVDNYIGELEKQLNEYKDKSSTINKAIINAQIAADNIIKAAHSETEKILTHAKKEAAELKQATINQIKYLKLNIANQKNLINNFRKDYEFLTEKYLNPLVTSDTDKVFDKLTEIEEAIDEISNHENVVTVEKKQRREKRHIRKERVYTEYPEESQIQKQEIRPEPIPEPESKLDLEFESKPEEEHNDLSGRLTALTPEETKELLS